MGYLLNLIIVLFSAVCTQYIAPGLLGRRRRPPKQPLIEAPRPSPVSQTLRLRDLPNDIDEITLRHALSDSAPVPSDERGPAWRSNVVRLSLTQQARSSGIPNSSVAAVCFQSLPRSLAQKITRTGEYIDTSVQLKIAGMNHTILVDNHFYGLTPLYWHQDWTVDIIAVTGWNGKAFNSWRPESSDSMWLRDWLGHDLAYSDCHARVLTFGYPSKVSGSECDATLYDYGQELLRSIKSIRSHTADESSAKPLIFVGHSLGGLVIKQALKNAYSSTHEDDRDIFQSCIGLIMFGVPNLGLDNHAILSMTYGQKNEMFARELGVESQYLPELENDFTAAFRGRTVDIIVICELLDSPSVKKETSGWYRWKKTRWSRTGPKIRMVSRASAWACGDSSEKLSSQTDHSNLVKFPNRHNGIYEAIVSRLVSMIKKVSDGIDGVCHDPAVLQSPLASFKPAAQYKSDFSNIKQIGVPDHIESLFVGRKRLLANIHACLVAEAGNQVFVLHGNGGMGKTQVALKYIETRSDSYAKILWIQAESERSIQESFRLAADSLGISANDNEDMTARVLNQLLRVEGRTLVVYDNLDDRSLIHLIGKYHKPLWKRSMRILITSRDREFLLFGTLDSCVEALNDDESLVLLQQLLENGDSKDPTIRDDLAMICNSLGHLPLGLKQAASYIKVSGIPPQQYLDQLEQQPQLTLGYTSEWWPYRKTVLNAWETTMKRVEEVSPYAAEWFCMCSFMDMTIPHPIFVLAHGSLLRRGEGDGRTTYSPAQRHIQWMFKTEASEHWNVALMRDKIRQLHSLSLIKTSSAYRDACTSAIHPLVQQWSRLRLERLQQIRYLVMASSLIHVCAEELVRNQKAQRDGITAFVAQRWLLTHAYSCMDFAERTLRQDISYFLPADCTVTFAILCMNERNYEKAQKMLETAIQRHTEDFIGLNNARRILSLVLRRQKKLTEAKSTQDAAIEELDMAGIDSHWKYRQKLRAQAELAVIHRDMRDFNTAYTLQTAVVGEMNRSFGEESVDALHEMSCLARILYQRGELTEALHTEERVLSVYRRLYSDRPEILDKMRNLAVTLYRLERYDDAIRLETEVLQGKEKLYHTENLEVASAMQNLATSFAACGRLREAVQLYSKTLAIRRSILGDLHEATQKTSRNMGDVERKLGIIDAGDDFQTQRFLWGKDRIDSGISVDG